MYGACVEGIAQPTMHCVIACECARVPAGLICTVLFVGGVSCTKYQLYGSCVREMRCAELIPPSFFFYSSYAHLNPDCLRLTQASLLFILPLASLNTAFHRVHYSIFAGSILSRSISGEATQHMHSFCVDREILSSIFLRKAGLELGGRWMQM